jgi:hypothetical protein
MSSFRHGWIVAIALVFAADLVHAQHPYERHARAYEGIHRLGGRVQIRHAIVDFRHVVFGRDHFALLRDLGYVGGLNLTGATIPMGSYGQLGTLPGLTDLNLSGTSTTDAALAQIGTVPSLRSIDLTGTQVTPAGAAVFQRLNPTAQIILGK